AHASPIFRAATRAAAIHRWADRPQRAEPPLYEGQGEKPPADGRAPPRSLERGAGDRVPTPGRQLPRPWGKLPYRRTPGLAATRRPWPRGSAPHPIRGPDSG